MAESAPVLIRRRSSSSPGRDTPCVESFVKNEILEEKAFMRMLYLERKRTERSSSRFVLMLLESASLLREGADERTVHTILCTVARSTRETDIKGWYREKSSIGVILTEIDTVDGRVVAAALLARVTDALCSVLGVDEIKALQMSFHVFPEQPDTNGQDGNIDLVLYPELSTDKDGIKSACLVKRAIDVIGSLLALMLAFPLMLAIAAGIKITSTGPIIFRQVRVGVRGTKFIFLKFRTMYSGNDQTIHEEYTKRLISGKAQAGCPARNEPVYKLKDDPRVTPVGRFLRKTSLDELPQFVNVLKGDMSLVGPRPPIPYEVESYAAWHKRRLLTVKPGITGLWQVGGRSRVKFDDMVRLDLKYAKSWSVSEDLKILLKTAGAVLSGDGAY